MTGPFEHSIARFLEPVGKLLQDPNVSEIMINGPGEIWVERGGLISKTGEVFPSRKSLDAALTNISQYAGRPLDHLNPILEAHLPDGSRLEAVLPPIAKDGPAVSIRRFSRSTLTVEKLVKLGSLTRQAGLFLARSVARHRNIVVSGGTGSGKTSLLGALSSFFSDGERTVVIEDTSEIQIQKPHVVYLEARAPDERGRGLVTIRDLLRATLRLRPDRIIVGEIRGREALDLVQAMTSGHGGSLTTVHANCPEDAIRRLETMALMADSGLPLQALRAQVASAVDLVVQAERTRDGKRQVNAISAVRGLSADGNYIFRKAFVRDEEGKLSAILKRGIKGAPN